VRAQHTPEEIREFWNSRAGLAMAAGSRDIVAKRLEIEAIAAYLRDGMRVLDAGCGNGVTAMEMVRRFDLDLTAFDFAPEMVKNAQESSAAAPSLRGRVSFSVGDVQHPHAAEGESGFDVIYTERVLINLTDWKSQAAAIRALTFRLKPGGKYVMCENSQDGLDELNALRERVGLDVISVPWHNRYFRDDELETFTSPGVRLAEVNYYSSTYYFLSRVANAWLAAREGAEPSYDAPLNQLALSLPPIGKLGQGRIWVWEKAQ
jgi:ubiquinone/menaquinone biosynthesis C-methylase UbiE